MLVVAALASLIGAAGCANPSSVARPAVPEGRITTAARSELGPCLVTSIDSLRSHGRQISGGSLPADLRRYRFSTDARSFAAVVTPSDLPGIAPFFSLNESLPGHPKVQGQVIAIVNHGLFARSTLPSIPLPPAGPGQLVPQQWPPPGSVASPPPPEPAVWAIYLFDEATHAPVVPRPIAEPSHCITG